MNCEIAHERIVTAAYGELADEQTHMNWSGTWPSARSARGAGATAGAEGACRSAIRCWSRTPNLMARSRLRLEEALDALPPRRWYERLGQRLINNFASLQAAPVAPACCWWLEPERVPWAATSLRRIARRTHQPRQTGTEPAANRARGGSGAPTEIANISSIVRQPNSQMVEVRYNQVVPQQIEGSLDDPAIRQLLMLASENSASAGVRDDSVGLLAAECRAGHSCKAAGIRDALMVALRYDKNAGVREKALHGLEPYVAEDVRVRDAVLEALMNDGDPRIRTAAINILEPVEGDTSVRQVLYSVSNSDRSPYIRNVSRQVLSRVPEIQ